MTLRACASVQVRYMSGMRCWKEVAASIIFLDAFKQGRIMLVMSTHKGEIHNLNSFLIKHHISGLTLSIDESDNVWREVNHHTTIKPVQSPEACCSLMLAASS